MLARACAADPAIRALDQAVSAMCSAARATYGPSCSACVWQRILKPLAVSLVGWDRGYPLRSARDPRPPGVSLPFVNMSELMAGEDERKSRRTPPAGDTEQWLRTQEAWDAVTGSWLERLHEADPARGHGIAYLPGVDS